MKLIDAGLVKLGKNIRYYRRISKLSQEELAEKTKLEQTYISGVERGHRNVSAKNLMRIAKILGVQVGELFPDINDVSLE